MISAYQVIIRFLSQHRVGKVFPDKKELRKYLQEHPKADKSKHTVKKQTVKKSDELKNLRSAKDEPEFDPKNVTTWKAEHRSVTPKGSIISGALHLDEDHPENVKYIKEHILPEFLTAAKKAHGKGKKVVFLAEGATEGFEGTEQEMLAKALKGKTEQDTWDDGEVIPFEWSDAKEKNILKIDSPVMKRLTEFAGDEDLAAAGVYAMLVGQGDELEVFPRVHAKLKKLGLDPGSQDALYGAAFPQDFGKPETKISRIADEYNRLRQLNLVKKIRRIESEGGIALVAPGASHAYQLKPVLE